MSDPETVVYEALRPMMPRRAAAHVAHVVVTTLRAEGQLKEPPSCACGPTGDEKAFAESAAKLAQMSDGEFDGLYQELVRGFDETGGSE